MSTATPEISTPQSVSDSSATSPTSNVSEKIGHKDYAQEVGENMDDGGVIRPTDEERQTLRRVAGSVPLIAWTLCAVEFAERASYYGCSQVFSNYIEFPLPAGGNGAGATPKGTQETAGALNMGETAASALTLLFSFLAYCVPIFGGWLADVKLGRWKVICLGVLICGLAHAVLVVGAIPEVIQGGHALAPFIIGLILLAFGAGLFKPNLFPVVLDQDRQKGLVVEITKSGERVIKDPAITAQSLALIYYGLVNVGAFFGLATTYSEKDVGYWLAFLLPGVIYMLLPILLFAVTKKIIKKPPGGNDLVQFFKVIFASLRNGFSGFGQKEYLDAVKPSVLAEKGITTIKGKPITWTDGFVEDTRRALGACSIFLFFPIYNLNDGGIGNIVTSQGSSMTTNGAPNDLLGNFNPLTIIVTVPILTYGFYPLLRKYKIRFGPIARITTGFLLGAISTMIGAVTQYYIYKTSPCGYYATGCTVGDGVSPITIWVQIPQYLFSGFSECLANTTALELAFSRAPKNMKGLVMSIYLFSTAISSAIAEGVTPALVDPHLIWGFAGTAIVGAAVAPLFYWIFRDLDNDEFLQDGVAEEQEGAALTLATTHDTSAGAGIEKSTLADKV